MNKLNLLLAGFLSIGIAQASPVLAGMLRTSSNEIFSAPPRRLVAQAVSSTQGGGPPWALSLSALVEHYHCAPRPSELQAASLRVANRYEMATLLRSCLDYLSDRRLDLREKSALQTLRSEFKLELAALQGNSGEVRWQDNLRSHSEAQGLDFTPALWFRSSGQTKAMTASPLWVTQSVGWQVGKGNFQWRGAATYTDSSKLDESAPRLIGVSAEADLGRVGIFGRYGLALGTKSGVSNQALTELTRQPTTDQTLPNWTAGIGIRDFIIPKSVLTLSAGRALTDRSTQPNPISYGAFYQFPVSDYLTLSPSVMIMTNPTTLSNPSIQGAVQASFSF